MRIRFIALFLALGAAAFAQQQWELGGAAGGGFMRNAGITGPAGTASAGFASGPAFGAYAGQNLYSMVSGELRYTYRSGDLRLASGGSSTTFSGMTHSVHYDILVHPRNERNKVMPFVAGGGGIRLFEGTGKEAAYQPLEQYAYLTKTHQLRPMISAGAGMKVRIKPNMYLRAEFRDYISPFPNQVIAPANGGKSSGWLHDIVPMVGISYLF